MKWTQLTCTLVEWGDPMHVEYVSRSNIQISWTVNVIKLYIVIIEIIYNTSLIKLSNSTSLSEMKYSRYSNTENVSF